MQRSRLTRSIWIATLPAVVTALTLTACGGSGSSASGTATVEPSPATDSVAATASTGAAPLPAPTATGTIAFSKVVSGTGSFGELTTVQADGTGLVQLAAGEEVSFKQPAWSSDGTKIAYILGNSSVRPWSYYPYAVWTMNAEGTGQTKLTKGKMRGSWPTWSPDGKQIAFVRALPPAEGDGIYVMNADGSGLRRLTDGDAPHWAPNGAIYFAGGAPSDVFRINADGSGLRQVTEGVEVGAFALSQDGKQLAVYDSFVDQIVTLPATGAGSPVVVVDQVAAKGYVPTHNGLPFGVALSWSPDGRALAFATSDMDDSAGSALYVVNVDGSGLSAVPDTGGVWDPAWRPE